MSGVERTEKLLETLKMAGVERAAFYVNTVRVSNAEQIERVNSYIKNGHLVGNHTHSHPNLEVVGAQNYIKEISMADSILKDKVPGYSKNFRYCYLRRGKDFKTRDQVYEYLDSVGYTDAYVTLDNYDWHIDYLMREAIKSGKKVNFKKLGKVYSKAIFDSAKFYDDLAKKVIGRSPKHVLLLHANDINALFIGELVNYFKSKGWKLTTPEEAYKDEIATRRPKTLMNNNGRISAIAAEMGYDGLLRDPLQDKNQLEKLLKENGVFE